MLRAPVATASGFLEVAAGPAVAGDPNGFIDDIVNWVRGLLAALAPLFHTLRRLLYLGVTWTNGALMTEPHDELIVGLALIALVAGTFALVRLRVEQQPVVVLDLAVPPHASVDVADWARFFLSLHAVRRPGWRGALFGQPCIAFEFQSDHGRLHARCAAPPAEARLVRALLRSAIDGIETSGER
jgi:hypothetical protein